MERQPLPRRLVVAALAALVLAASAGAADAPLATVTQRLPGLDDAAAGGFEPPDVQVAAGSGFVVEMVNLAARIWRTGAGPAQQVATEQLSPFFAAGGDRLTDPRIIYDTLSNRWLATISDLDTSSVRLAVSTTADPTGRWTISSYQAGGCADQPRLGVADGVVVIGADIYRDCQENAARAIGSELWVVNKDQLLAGSTTPPTTTYGPDPAFMTLAPVQSQSPTASEYVVSVDQPFSRVVHVLEVAGVPPAAVTVRELAKPAIARLARPPFASQPPTSSGRSTPGIETNDSRVLDAVWEDGRLWLSANDSCVPAGDTVIRSCARVIELATPSLTVTSDTDLAEPGLHLFYPALRPDGNGDVIVVVGQSGPTRNPETAVIARTQSGALTPEVVVARSVGPYLGERYGDYFGAATDPADPSVVWVAGESGAAVPGEHGWVTTVASVAVTPVGGTPPAVVAQTPPGVRALRRAGHAGKVVRLGYLSLDDGAGVQTVVTVRADSRGKRVVFTATAGPFDLRTGVLYHVSWRPAKTLRGAFAYCVHSVTADGSASPASCATVTLR